MGVFNVVHRAQERNGCRFKPSRAVDFNLFIRTNELSEVKQGGRRFTWVSSNGEKHRKLDRVLVNTKFLQEWPDVGAVVKYQVFADHCHVLLKARSLDFGPSPFKFFDQWLTEEGFKDMLKTVWKSLSPISLADVTLREKLKAAKNRIKEWRKSNIDRVGGKMEATKEVFLVLDKQAEERELSAA